MNTAILSTALVVAALMPAHAQAQSWPVRPVRVIVPFPAGGPADVLGRVMAMRFTEVLKQQFVIDNRPGANGNIGATLVAKAPNDGYTIMFATTGPLALNRLMYAKTTTYDPARDFAPVSLFADMPLIVVANQTTPLKTLQEAIAHARANPDKLTYSSPGHGSMAHLTAELIQRSTGVKLTHVPYKGSSPALTEFLGGSVNLAMDLASAYIPHLKTGNVRALAISTATRFALLPDVPTVIEAGVPGYHASGWFGIVGPPDMPQSAVTQLNKLSNDWLASSEGASRLRDMGARPIGGTPADLGAFVRSEITKWRPVVEPIAASIQ
jgi:tripartite-type tricarboxylate transporter receptor subunit TctC